MAVDQLAIRGVDIVTPSDRTLSQIRSLGVEISAGRIVDLTLAGTAYPVMKGALDAMLGADEFDLVLATIGSSARFQPELAVKPVIDSAGSKNPLAAYVVPDAPQAIRSLAAREVPAFRTPEVCADAVAAVLLRRVPTIASTVNRRYVGPSIALTEAKSHEVLAGAGIPSLPYVVIEVDAPVPTLPFPYPVAVKLLHEAIAHKSDVEGVILGISNAGELADAIICIGNSLRNHRPDLKFEGVLVQPMARRGAEGLVGFRHDRNVGPIVLLAAGGAMTELYRDRAVRMAPVDLPTAREMIDEVRFFRSLAGFRGAPRFDLDALANTVVSVSRFAEMQGCCVDEAEINPLMIYPEHQGVLAIDALVSIFPEEQVIKNE